MVEDYGSYRFRYCHDVDSPGHVRVYIERQPAGATAHRLHSGDGAPPHICIKDGDKPSSLSAAQDLAHQWARCNDNYRRGYGFRE